MEENDVLAIRQSNSKPILKEIHDWLIEKKSKVLPKSAIGLAINYTIGQWKVLNEYVNDGKLSIDNNVAERAIRPIAIGRKNYMFCGSHEGAKRAALIYTIVETCKLQGIEPFEYMRDVIDRISGYPMKKIYDLTPMGWAKFKNRVII